MAVSDSLIITNAAGAVVKKIVVNESSKEGTAFHPVTGVKFNMSMFGSPDVLVEPNGTISDIVGIHMGGTASAPVFRFGFASDSERASPNLKAWLGPNGSPTSIQENGPIDVTQFLNTAAGSGQEGWRATFQSDVETPPPGIAMLAQSMAGVAGGAGHSLSAPLAPPQHQLMSLAVRAL